MNWDKLQILQTIAWLSLCATCIFALEIQNDAWPCFQSSLTEGDLTNLLNPRPSADLTLLLNLPFGYVFCSPTKYRFISIGPYIKRHQLRLNASQPFFGGRSSAAFSDDPDLLVKDVSFASESFGFDYLVHESDGLLENTEYFVAFTGCSSPLLCRTIVLAKFTTVRQRGGDVDDKNYLVNLVILIAICIASVFILGVFASGLVWFFCCRRGRLMGTALRRLNESGNSRTSRSQQQDRGLDILSYSNRNEQPATAGADAIQMETISFSSTGSEESERRSSVNINKSSKIVKQDNID